MEYGEKVLKYFNVILCQDIEDKSLYKKVKINKKVIDGMRHSCNGNFINYLLYNNYVYVAIDTHCIYFWCIDCPEDQKPSPLSFYWQGSLTDFTKNHKNRVNLLMLEEPVQLEFQF